MREERLKKVKKFLGHCLNNLRSFDLYVSLFQADKFNCLVKNFEALLYYNPGAVFDVFKLCEQWVFELVKVEALLTLSET